MYNFILSLYFKHNGMSCTKITYIASLLQMQCGSIWCCQRPVHIAKCTATVLQKLMVAQLVLKFPAFSGIHIYLLPGCW